MASSSQSNADPEFTAGLEVVQAALNAAAMRRSKVLSGTPAVPHVPKRKKAAMAKDISKNPEKVTPDPKFSKSSTSSSLTSSATEKDDPTVCNLESRLNAAVDTSGGAATSVTASAPVDALPNESQNIDVDMEGSDNGKSGEGDVVPPSRMTTLSYSPTLEMLDHAAREHHSATPASASPTDCLIVCGPPCSSFAAAKPNHSEASVKEPTTMAPDHVPVATPSRALATFWSKYKVPRPHVNPTEPSTTEVLVRVEPHAEPAASAGTEVPMPVPVEPEVGPHEVGVNQPSSTGTVIDLDHVTSPDLVGPSVNPSGSSGTNGCGGLTRGESSASFATDDLESGWRYDEKCKKQAAKLAAPVPGDDSPYDGPTIANTVPSAVPEEPSPGDLKGADSSMGDTASTPPSETGPVPTTVPCDPKPTETFLVEFNKLCQDEHFDKVVQRLQKMDQQQIDAKVLEVVKHPSFPGFVAHIRSLFSVEGGTYTFGGDDPVEELAAFETWCQAETNCNPPPPTPPVLAPPTPPQVRAVRAVLTRATTVDLTPAASAKQPPAVKVEPKASAPVPAPSPAPQATEDVRQKVMRAKKAKWHRSMKSSKCPPEIKERLKELQSRGEGGARDQAGWDDLFNKFIECGEDWSKSELVCKSVSVREKSQTGTWALMSRKELDDKYANPDAVNDLISRKVALGHFEENPDFPGVEEHRVYWCWKTTTETDKTGHHTEAGTSTTGKIDAPTAKSLASKPIAAPTPAMALKCMGPPAKPDSKDEDKQEAGNRRKPKPQKEPKAKAVPKAKTATQEATQAMKTASTVILECKSWRAKLNAAGLPSNMVEAMVTDTSVHLGKIQTERDSLEAKMEGKPDEDISQCVQKLAQHIKDYKLAAGHVKKHLAKPKKAKEPDEADQSAEPAIGK